MTTKLKKYHLGLLAALRDEIGEGSFALESDFVRHQYRRAAVTRQWLRELRALGLVTREYCGWLCNEGCEFRDDFDGGRPRDGKHLKGCGRDAELRVTPEGLQELEDALPYVLQRISNTTGEVLGEVAYDSDEDALFVLGHGDLPEDLQGVGYVTCFRREDDGMYAVTPAIVAQRAADGLR